jgi:acyl-CoA thioesterase II
MESVQQLLDLLTLTKTESLEFKGQSISIGSPYIFGGQVISQALNAACRTVEKDRFLHSTHAYFLEKGNLYKNLTFKVSVIRDGKSFSVRRVTVTQEGINILILAASFHIVEDNYSHQQKMDTSIPQPEDLLSWDEYYSKFKAKLPLGIKEFLSVKRPVEFKPSNFINTLNIKSLSPFSNVWFRLKGNVEEVSIELKKQILAYISDYNLLMVASFPFADQINWQKFAHVSLDHSIWFFRDFDFKDWMLFSFESPNANNSRGFSRGHIYNRNGNLVASVSQEGLFRELNE